jgi:acylphosphatase
MEKGDIAVRVRITGRVQGVYFRGWTQAEAEALGLEGWVRNEPDGSVTALIVGADDLVSHMIDKLWQGPPSAEVYDVQIEPADIAERPTGFHVAR